MHDSEEAFLNMGKFQDTKKIIPTHVDAPTLTESQIREARDKLRSQSPIKHHKSQAKSPEANDIQPQLRPDFPIATPGT